MKNKQLYYEDIKEGMQLPKIQYGPITTEMIVRFVCASNNFHPIHYDKDIARAEGHPDVVVHGPLKLALFERLIREWIGESGILKQITATYSRPNYAGDTLTVTGNVSRTFLENGEGFVECDIWSKDQEARVNTKGSALVILPIKEGKAI